MHARCCRPAITRSIAWSKSACVISWRWRAAGGDRRLVADVREIGAGQAGGVPRDRVEVDVGGERLAARVHEQDLAAALQVGRLDEDLAVEAARAKQGRVEILEPVRGAHDDDLVARAEAVELDEQLVQRLVLLAVEARARCGRCRRRRARR